MQRPRVLFQSVPSAAVVTWILVSPNNRSLGRAASWLESYEVCSASLQALIDGQDRLRPSVVVDESGKWTWLIKLDDAVVAVAHRSYLRLRESTYNLTRFLEALPVADVVPGVRVVQSAFVTANNRDAVLLGDVR